MKITVAGGACVRLTGRKYSSLKGETYDLAALGGTQADFDRLVALPVVTPVGRAKSTAKTGADS